MRILLPPAQAFKPLLLPPVQRSKGRAADSTPHTRGTLTACLSVHAALASTNLLLEKEGEWERALLLAPRQLLASRPAAHPRFAAVLSRLDASHSWLGQDAITRVGDEPREEDTRGGGRAHHRHGLLEARFSQPVDFSTAALAGLLLCACAAQTAAIATEDSRRRSWLSPSSPARRSSMLALASYFRLGALRSERVNRGITVALEGFSLQMAGGIAASGAHSGREGGRGDVGRSRSPRASASI